MRDRAMSGFIAAAIGAFLMLPLTAARAEVGFELAQADDPAGPPLEVGLWFPTTAPDSPQSLELFTQDVAVGAPVAGCCHPLIVFSHGNGGSLGGHYDTALALAQAGFVVAAVTHTGDNWRDHSAEMRLQDRPRHVTAVIDFVLSHWRGQAAVDAGRIGVFGFSAGGFTALVAIGGKPDLTRVGPYCSHHAETFVCRLVKSHAGEPSAPIPASAWRAEPRIRAAVVAAPAIGFTFGGAGLRGVTVPVQLWAAGDDQILPVADNATIVDRSLPASHEYHLVPNADHFDFLAPCSEALALAVPTICGERHGFDRTIFHQAFDASVVAFFQRTLAR